VITGSSLLGDDHGEMRDEIARILDLAMLHLIDQFVDARRADGS
jgi:hypothetical protein